MKKTILRAWIAVLALALLGLSLTACQGGGEQKATEVIIGTGNAYNPYCYLDENNNLTGFEKALLDQIDEKLPEYSFTYQTMDFANILLSLESGKIDLATHQFEFNIERNEKYLYGKEGYTTYPLFLVVRGDDDSIKTWDDLAGKKVISTSTTNNADYIMNKWNEEHGSPFEIVFASDAALALDDLASGKGDAMVLMNRLAESYKVEYNADIKLAGDEPVVNSNTFYLYNKQNGQELSAKIDAVLKELKADGTVKRLSEEWLGGDFVAKD
jgi:L-cystine transport system substrate-binding protein